MKTGAVRTDVAITSRGADLILHITTYRTIRPPLGRIARELLKAVLLAVVGPIEIGRAFEPFVATIPGMWFDFVEKIPKFVTFEGSEVTSGGHVLLQFVHRSNADNEGGNILAEGKADAFFRGGHIRLDNLPITPAQTFHANDPDLSFLGGGNQFFGETPVEMIADVDRALDRVPCMHWKHFEMNVGRFVPRETDIADFAGFLRFKKFGQPALLHHPFRVVVPVDFMHLHEINDIRIETFEALVDHLANAFGIAGTNFGHEEASFSPFAAIGGECFPHDEFTAAIVVIPTIVEEGEAFVDRRVHDFDGVLGIFDGSDVPATQAENRDVLFGFAEGAGG